MGRCRCQAAKLHTNQFAGGSRVLRQFYPVICPAIARQMRRDLSNKLETATKMVMEYHVTHNASLLEDAGREAVLVNKSDEVSHRRT